MPIPVRVFMMLLASLLLGCAAVGDFFVPRHPKSGIADPDKLCVRLLVPPQESLISGEAIAATIAKVVVSQLGKAIEKESKRYTTTYSARASAELISVPKLERKDQQPQAHLAIETIQVYRLTGENPPKCDEITSPDKTAMYFSARLEISDRAEAIRLDPKVYEFHQARAKVASPSVLKPWSWWMYLDESKRKVDVNVQVRFTGIATTKSGRSEVSIMEKDFPLGKVDLDKGKRLDQDQAQRLSSGWVPLPQIELPPTLERRTNTLPINLTVTVIESNELGDVIAKGAKSIGDSESKLADLLEKLLGSDATESSAGEGENKQDKPTKNQGS